MAPPTMRLTEALVARAVAEALAGAPPSGEIWIFAYGSLIWNPGFGHVKDRLCSVAGWRRCYCQGWVPTAKGKRDSMANTCAAPSSICNAARHPRPLSLAAARPRSPAARGEPACGGTKPGHDVSHTQAIPPP